MADLDRKNKTGNETPDTIGAAEARGGQARTNSHYKVIIGLAAAIAAALAVWFAVGG